MFQRCLRVQSGATCEYFGFQLQNPRLHTKSRQSSCPLLLDKRHGYRRRLLPPRQLGRLLDVLHLLRAVLVLPREHVLIGLLLAGLLRVPLRPLARSLREMRTLSLSRASFVLLTATDRKAHVRCSWSFGVCRGGCGRSDRHGCSIMSCFIDPKYWQSAGYCHPGVCARIRCTRSSSRSTNARSDTAATPPGLGRQSRQC